MGLPQVELEAALDELATRDSYLCEALATVGYPATRHRAADFSTLLQIITAQQISTQSAAAVWRKLQAHLDHQVSAKSVYACSEESLHAAGLSARKASYARELAQKCLSGELDLPQLSTLSDEAAITAICQVRGLGRWSAEIYLLFAEGRADVWPADDLAIQVAFQRLHGLAERPRGKHFYPLVQKWSPHRGACALLMWKLYGTDTLST